MLRWKPNKRKILYMLADEHVLNRFNIIYNLIEYLNNIIYDSKYWLKTISKTQMVFLIFSSNIWSYFSGQINIGDKTSKYLIQIDFKPYVSISSSLQILTFSC